MQHCPARAAQRLAAAVLALVLLLCAFLPRAHAAELKEKNGIRLLSFDTSHILSIGNQTSGKCSLYALRYALVPAPAAWLCRARKYLNLDICCVEPLFCLFTHFHHVLVVKSCLN